MGTTQSIARWGTALLVALVFATTIIPTATASQSDTAVIDQAALTFEINRARWDPAGFISRADDITMPAGVLPAPPLAFHATLTSSAAFKANEIADHGYFAHQSAVTGIWPNELARIHGYPLPPSFSDTVNNIESLHGGSPDPFRVLVSFANSASHRKHLFGEGWFLTHKQVGVGRSDNQNYWAVHTAYANESDRFVTGFVYDDANGNRFMERGEGLGGVTVSVGSTSVVTNAGGAYSIPVAAGSRKITFSGGPLGKTVSGTFTVGSYNVTADYILGDPKPVIRAYELCNGAQPTILGTDGDDVVYATSGKDIIQVLGGNNTIIGAGSDDIICAASGSVTLVNGGTRVERLAGTTRFETAVAVSQANHPNGADVVYLATGNNYPDAISAGPAAAAASAPILLTHRHSMPAATIAELKRLNPPRVLLLGGTQTLGSDIANQVRTVLPGVSVTRIAGPTRYETSVEISKASFEAGVDTVYVASGVTFPDALVAAPAAYAVDGPLLLVERDAVPDEVRAELSRLGASRIVILGSTASVSSSVASLLGQYAPTVQRVAGSDRYATSAALSKAVFPNGATTVYVAVGSNFPDALTGGAAIHTDLGPVLLVQTDSIPSVVRTELLRLRPSRIVILGGTTAVSWAVQVELANLFG